MTFAEIGKRFRHARKKFDWVSGNGVREAIDGFVKFGRDWVHREPLESANQGVREAVQAITVSDNAFALDIVEHFPDLFGGIIPMVKEGNETGDGALKIDVVFPERVVRIDKQSLSAVCVSESH